MKSLSVWGAVAMVVIASSTGEVLLSSAMKRIGDLGLLRARKGMPAVIAAVFRERLFLPGLACMAVGFFSLLLALSWDDASFVAPASASLTLVLNAVMAKIFLKEAVDHRRWISALLVGVGVVLVAM
ncbi:MAG: hypothetical protein LAP21_14060 [Acidobacteriia bacterium]|nr:hypothetical protein [Terriglobia bacterium]